MTVSNRLIQATATPLPDRIVYIDVKTEIRERINATYRGQYTRTGRQIEFHPGWNARHFLPRHTATKSSLIPINTTVCTTKTVSTEKTLKSHQERHGILFFVRITSRKGIYPFARDAGNEGKSVRPPVKKKKSMAKRAPISSASRVPVANSPRIRPSECG